MKVLSTEGLTKLIQLIKSAFISVDDTIATSTIDLANVATSGSYNDLTNKPVVDQTYDGTSANAQSGIAVEHAINTVKRNIGEVVASTIPLTDAGLHLLDGSLISGSGVYSEFFEYIASIYDASANYFCTESDWQNSVTTYGVCGKFVYDSVNNTVRLPKITGIIEGTTDVSALGDLIEAGLPNITGELNIGGNAPNLRGAFYKDGTQSGEGGGDGGTDAHGYFDASRCSSIYGNSTTVQPQTIKAFYYIVVATSTKTDIQVDIDEIATDLNGKADTDLSNLSATGQKVIDGQWVQSFITLMSSSNTINGVQIDLSSYLPDDGYNYDVKFNLKGYDDDSPYYYHIETDIFDDGDTSTGSSNYVQLWGGKYSRQNMNTFDLPVGIGRYIKVYGSDADEIYIYALGYRRLGTNS